MKFGMLIGDVPRTVDPVEQLDGILRQVEAGPRAGLSQFVIGHHFLYGELRWLQPIPLLARLAGEVDEHVRLGMTVLLAPLYNPIVLAEDLATLDILDEDDLMNDYYETVKDSVALDTAQEVIDHFIRVSRELPIDPIIIKPQWPQMHIDEVIDAIETMGQQASAELDPERQGTTVKARRLPGPNRYTRKSRSSETASWTPSRSITAQLVRSDSEKSWSGNATAIAAATSRSANPETSMRAMPLRMAPTSVSASRKPCRWRMTTHVSCSTWSLLRSRPRRSRSAAATRSWDASEASASDTQADVSTYE